MKSKRTIVLTVCAALAVGTLGSTQPAEAATARKATVSKKATVGKKAATGKKASVSKKTTAKHKKAVSHKQAVEQESGELALQSAAVVVQDPLSGEVLYEKNSGAVLPIASISKLMTAMVVLDAQQSLNETLTIGEDDVDTLKGTHSRLKVGVQLPREEMLLLALMASENRAASALSRHYPGGRQAFIAAMNRKAQAIGLNDTHFSDPTGLTSENVSSARDLARMVSAASHYPLIRELSTTTDHTVMVEGRPTAFRNTNPLVRSPTSGWEIALQKTGFIREAGKCLVMQAWLSNRPVVIVLLDSWGKLTRIGDANRIKHWIESVAASRARPSAALKSGTSG